MSDPIPDHRPPDRHPPDRHPPDRHPPDRLAAGWRVWRDDEGSWNAARGHRLSDAAVALGCAQALAADTLEALAAELTDQRAKEQAAIEALGRLT